MYSVVGLPLCSIIVGRVMPFDVFTRRYFWFLRGELSGTFFGLAAGFVGLMPKGSSLQSGLAALLSGAECGRGPRRLSSLGSGAIEPRGDSPCLREEKGVLRLRSGHLPRSTTRQERFIMAEDAWCDWRSAGCEASRDMMNKKKSCRSATAGPNAGCSCGSLGWSSGCQSKQVYTVFGEIAAKISSRALRTVGRCSCLSTAVGREERHCKAHHDAEDGRGDV